MGLLRQRIIFMIKRKRSEDSRNRSRRLVKRFTLGTFNEVVALDIIPEKVHFQRDSDK